MDSAGIVNSSQYVSGILAQFFEGHGVRAVPDAGQIRFPDYPALWVNGELFRSSDRIAQLDVRLGGFDGDRVLIESIAGVGADPAAQARAAIEAFANASFHVLLPAFFGRPPCHGTERETWTIGGRPRPVY